MRELENVFATLRCNDGRMITFGEWATEGRWGPEGDDWMLTFAFRVQSEWCEAIGYVQDILSGMKEFCEELKALSSRNKPSIYFAPMYGRLGLEFTVNNLGNFEIKGNFKLSEYSKGWLYEEFETYELAINEFREGIESVVAIFDET